MITTEHLPSPDQVMLGSKAFEVNVRDAIYKTATFLVRHHWCNPKEVSEGMGVLLLTWNQAFYRYGQFSFDMLEKCVRHNKSRLQLLRDRSILDYLDGDERVVRKLFEDFSIALAIESGPKSGVRSPVATAKALHLLAPSFFPLWDAKIAKAYGFQYKHDPAKKYLDFMNVTRKIADTLPNSVKDGRNGRSAIKVIDEYNFARYTREWVR